VNVILKLQKNGAPQPIKMNLALPSSQLRYPGGVAIKQHGYAPSVIIFGRLKCATGL
jgi:hypothetical protein